MYFCCSTCSFCCSICSFCCSTCSFCCSTLGFVYLTCQFVGVLHITTSQTIFPLESGLDGDCVLLLSAQVHLQTQPDAKPLIFWGPLDCFRQTLQEMFDYHVTFRAV